MNHSTPRIVACFTLLSLLLIAPLQAADPPKVYQPVGAPADPKVQVHWNRYHDHAQATKLLQALAKAFPQRCRLLSLGKSFAGREMWLMILSDFSKGAEPPRPAMWIDGGIHGNEIQGPEVVLYTCWYLLEMADRSDTIRKMLDERTFYLLPMLNPDGRQEHMHAPNTTHALRSGVRPVDDDGDGLFDEDGLDDLDGDGHITQMRIADPNGNYKPHPEFPNLLVKLKPGEKGQYRLLGPEGIDNDGDGRVNEDGPGFYDPNRDWAWLWQPEYIQNGAFRYPFSLMESRVVADFIMAHPNIAAAQTYHNAGGMILRGPGAKEDHFEPADIPIFEIIGKKGEMMLPGYRYLILNQDLYVTYGAEVDWLYTMQGALTFTNELWTSFNYFRKASEQPGFFGSEEDIHSFNRHLLLNDGFVPWHTVDHPQFGRIEVGGFKKNWVRQPPSFMLEEECHRNMAFSLYHADQMPLVKIQSATVKNLGGGVSEITAILENQRLIPSRLAVNVKRHLSLPDQVTITGSDLKVITGLIDDEPFFRRPREQKLQPATLKLESIAGHDVLYVRWLVTGPGPYEIRLNSLKGGSDSMTVLGGK